MDLGCGFGRHSRLLASNGYTVLAFDLDHRRLKVLAALLRRPRLTPLHIYAVRADVCARHLPLKARQLDLALAVHCPIHSNLDAIANALRPGGFLIYETFGGQGMNWQELPKAGHLRRLLGKRFEILALEERRVGPQNERAVAANLFARKRTSKV